ncbi:NAD dependent epimerase/dehydratase family protein, expressed [Zostera marina]|uniref:NAD dependent epimerase/dehydratase family protein, expressed n=1 Tax=Zostera marina TaxID=29655 RepID=A0A0K9PGB8_ZOSMR|nr:NAD dependent epimerase/dehydratase family protein, expressed [Zostera marina]
MATRLIFNLPPTNQTTYKYFATCDPPSSLTSNPILLRSFRFHKNHSQLSVNTARRRRRPSSSLQTQDVQDNPNPGKLVLVVGATGGVGQLVVASLLSRNIRSRLLIRDLEKGRALFGEQYDKDLDVVVGDTRNPEDLNPAMFKDVSHVICCTGTTAFPSKRWDGENTPEKVDWEGVRNFVSSLPTTVKRLVHVSSVGVTKCNSLLWSIMNLFGVLKYKKMGEDFVINAGIPFTIIRPGRLTDGPYTSYDLNTLLKATAGVRRAVIIGQGDKLQGETSRHVVAEACIQALDIECTRGQIYEINSIEGEGPENDVDKWVNLFKDAATNK